jgi:hypothetical protein
MRRKFQADRVCFGDDVVGGGFRSESKQSSMNSNNHDQLSTDGRSIHIYSCSSLINAGEHCVRNALLVVHPLRVVFRSHVTADLRDSSEEKDRKLDSGVCCS